MIYIASPYSNPDPIIREKRYHAVQNYCASLMQRGVLCFSPIVYGHPMAKRLFLPKSFEYWADFNDWFLLRCDEVRVLKLEGWESSRGVQYELELAEKHGIPVTMVDP